MATTTTNFGWDIPQSTDLVKDGATAIAALGQDIDTALVDLKGGTTGQILSKASDTDLDYTWVSANPGDITAVTAGTGISGGGTSGDVTITNSMATAIDAKGDLIAGTGSDAFSRLAVGTNGQLLTADSTAATGMAWTTVSSGGMTLLSTTTLSGASTAISSISGSYKDLYVRVYNVQYSTGSGAFVFDQNGSTLGYQQTGTTYNSTTSAYLTNNAGSGKISGLSLDRAGGENWFSLYFPNYSSTSNKKRSFEVFGGMESGAADAAVQSAGVYRTNPAVALSTLTFYAPAGTFSSGTVLIYGAN